MPKENLPLDSSIIVCTRRRPEQLGYCLRSIKDSSRGENYEIIVVDNTDGDKETCDLAADLGATYVVEAHKGLSRARNRGRKEARSGIIVFVDDDATVASGWLSHLIRPFHDPTIGAVGGRILPTADSTEIGALDLGITRRITTPGQADWSRRLLFECSGYGGNLAIRASVFDSCGFDVRLGRGASISVGEDNDIMLQIASLGYSLAYEPEAVVYHPDPQFDDKSEILAGYQARAAYLVYTWLRHPQYRHNIQESIFDRRLGLRSARTLDEECCTPSKRELVFARFRGIVTALREYAKRDP